MKTTDGVKGIVFSLVFSLIKGLGAKAIGIIVKGLILGVIFSLVLTPLIIKLLKLSTLLSTTQLPPITSSSKVRWV